MRIGDFEVEYFGSVVALTGMTHEARTWIEENVYFEPWQAQGPTVMIDRRFAGDIIEAIKEGFACA